MPLRAQDLSSPQFLHSCPLTFSLVLPSVAVTFSFATPVITRPLSLETRVDDVPSPTGSGPPSAAASADDSDFDLDDFDLDAFDFDDFDLDDLDLGASDLDDLDDDDGIGDSDVDVGVDPADPAAVHDLVLRDRCVPSCDLYDVAATCTRGVAKHHSQGGKRKSTHNE